MATRLLAHRLCIAEDWVELVPASAEALREATFVDGRTDIWSGEARRQRLSDFLMVEEEPAPVPRYIFHLGFGGSTLLTRLLTHPGHALVLREPKCLADAAKQKAAVLDSTECLLPVLEALKRHLARPWAPGETVIVKPTNWVNGMLMELLQGAPVKALFLTTTRERYLPTLFHGGGYRLFLALKAAQRFTVADPRLQELLVAAARCDDQPLDRLARSALAAHEIQMRLFRAAANAFGFTEANWLDGADLAKDPVAAAGRAAAALELELPEGIVEDNAAYWANRHAKSPESGFSPEARERAIASSFEQTTETIAAALKWADGEFGPEETCQGT